jgi:hypothetical protein
MRESGVKETEVMTIMNNETETTNYPLTHKSRLTLIKSFPHLIMNILDLFVTVTVQYCRYCKKWRYYTHNVYMYNYCCS